MWFKDPMKWLAFDCLTDPPSFLNKWKTVCDLIKYSASIFCMIIMSLVISNTSLSALTLISTCMSSLWMSWNTFKIGLLQTDGHREDIVNHGWLWIFYSIKYQWFFFQIDSQLTFMRVKKKGNRTLQKNLQLVLSSNPVFSSLLQFGDIANFSCLILRMKPTNTI